MIPNKKLGQGGSPHLSLQKEQMDSNHYQTGFYELLA